MNHKIKNATPTIYKGIKFRSKLEARIAELLDKNNIPYKYETLTITLLPSFKYKGKTYRAWTYTPDFIVFDNKMIEVKGFANDAWSNKQKMILNWIITHNNEYEFYLIKNLTQMSNLIKQFKDTDNEETK